MSFLLQILRGIRQRPWILIVLAVTGFAVAQWIRASRYELKALEAAAKTLQAEGRYDQCQSKLDLYKTESALELKAAALAQKRAVAAKRDTDRAMAALLRERIPAPCTEAVAWGITRAKKISQW